MTRLKQNAFNGGIITEDLYARDDVEKFGKSLKDGVNILVRSQGGFANRAGLEKVTAFDTHDGDAYQWLVPFAFNTTQTYQIEFATGKFRVIKDGAYVLDTAVGEVAVDDITNADPATIVLNDAADAASFPVGCLAYLSDPNGTHRLHDTVVQVSAVASAVLTLKMFDGATVDTSDAALWGESGAGVTIQKVYEGSHGITLSDMPKVRYAQDADTMYLTHPSYAPKKLTRADHDDWTFADVVFVPGLAAPVGGGAVATGTGSEVYTYTVSAIAPETFEESLPATEFSATNDLTVAGQFNTLSWTAHAGASRYNVYRKSAGAFGYIGTTDGISFVDRNITPDTTRGVRTSRNPFNAAGDYPSIVGFYEQRLAFGATLNDPQLVEMSRTENVENFGATYPQLADDAFRFRLRARQVNTIRAFVPHTAFGIFTSGGEWEIAAQGDGEYQRPDARRLSPTTYHGSADIEPLVTGDVALFVDKSGNVVRDYQLVDRSAPPGDLTIMAWGLLEDRAIISWAYAAAPFGTVWVVLDDGSVLSLTYVPEHDVWGWTRHEFGGTGVVVRQVSVIEENAVAVPYFVVSRTIGGGQVTTVERLARRVDTVVEDAYFVDGGVKRVYDAPTAVVEGLHHLRGQTVVALADGDVVENLVVDAAGSVDLGANSATKISIGLPYEASGETLPVSVQTREYGSSDGVLKAASEIAVRLKRSRGVEVSTHNGVWATTRDWDASMLGGPIPLATETALVGVDADWSYDAYTRVRQRHPLPMTVLSITPNWELSA